MMIIPIVFIKFNIFLYKEKFNCSKINKRDKYF